MYARKKEESGENSSNSMDVTMDSKGKSEAGYKQEARDSPLPSVSAASAPATPATPATPSTSQTKQPRQKKGQSHVKFEMLAFIGPCYALARGSLPAFDKLKYNFFFSIQT